MHLRPLLTGHLLLLLTTWILTGGWTHQKVGVMKKRFTIEDNSHLQLKGTSNVNVFTCDCEDRYAPQTFEVEQQGETARFHHTSLKINTQKFNCHNGKIDHDMRKALKSDKFPYIQIDLLETRQDARHFQTANRTWFDVQAKVKLTICGIAKTKNIPAKAQVLSDNQFRLKGFHPIQMSEFGIDPPQAMFGLIQVNDQIDFHFDLYVSISEIQ